MLAASLSHTDFIMSRCYLFRDFYHQGRIPNIQQSQKPSAAGKITPLLEHEANHSQLLWTIWSSPISNTWELKWKHILIVFLCFLKKPKLENSHYTATSKPAMNPLCVGFFPPSSKLSWLGLNSNQLFSCWQLPYWSSYLEGHGA